MRYLIRSSGVCGWRRELWKFAVVSWAGRRSGQKLIWNYWYFLWNFFFLVCYFFRSPFTQYMAFNQSHDVVWWKFIHEKKDRVNKREEQRKGFGWVGIGAKQPSSTSSWATWELRSFLMMILKGKEIRCVHGNESIYPMFLRVFYEKKDKSFMLNEYRINYLENNFLSSSSKQFSVLCLTTATFTFIVERFLFSAFLFLGRCLRVKIFSFFS